ncbi:hybrid sensor histidine kinase/response regulator [Noviherbaspirillum sp. CPCC 100848]|uniref:histidine kinase n=1 Tax=Noviherbaspirillum album TaxID=3080276 RepID=A0ABU6JA30_9BURK|nr:hybrid sensor histidine kinase/response regulator [Noviherbaspirillum sp. CPCC 100848]MEC4720390.1 hybrid sensor histidine kinase/response regulator [Noviherbaspirillum sp. CPCC 100848]
MKNVFKTRSGLVGALSLAGVAVAGSCVSYVLLSTPCADFDFHTARSRAIVSATQYQLAIEQLGTALYRSGSDPTVAKAAIDRCIRELRSAYTELTSPKALGAVSYVSDDVKYQLVQLGAVMDHLVREIRANPSPDMDETLLVRFEEVHQKIDAVAEKIRASGSKDHSLIEHISMRQQVELVAVQLLWWSLMLSIAYHLMRSAKARNEPRPEPQDAQRSDDKVTQLYEERIRKAEAAIMAKNMFFATISHELRSPLQAITASIDALAVRARNDKDREAIERLEVAAGQLEAQMKDLTDYARLDAGKMQLRPGDFNPTDLLRKLVSNFQTAAKQKNQRFITDFRHGNVKIHSDAYRFQQIATNLISNAVKYGGEGEVTVRLLFVDQENGPVMMRLTVEDQGSGFTQQQAETLFEPFTQIDQSNTRRQEGAGMGLAIVKRLVELMGGSIKAVAQPGQGGRFEVRVPVQIVAEDADSNVEAAKFGSFQHTQPAPYGAAATLGGRGANVIPGKRRILLVDDRADIRKSVKDLLESMDYDCELSDGAYDALKKMANRSYDAILLDIQMPDLDGFGVAQQVRDSDGPNKYAPIVAITAQADHLSTPEKRQVFDGYLVKPVRYAPLHATLREVIRAAQGTKRAVSDVV